MRKAYIVEDDKDSTELVVELLSDELDIQPARDGVTFLRKIRDDDRV